MKRNPHPLSLLSAFLLFILLTPATTNGQESYFGFGAARAIGTGGVLHPLFEQSHIEDNITTTYAKRVTLGQALHYRVSYIHYWNDYLGISLEGTMVRGIREHFSSQRKIVYVQHTARNVRCNGFAAEAGFTGRFRHDYVAPYLMVMPGFFSGSMELLDTITYGETTTSSQWKYSGLRALSIAIATGMDIHVTNQFTLFVQVKYTAKTVSPVSGKLIRRNGSDHLEDIPVSEKQIAFVDRLVSDFTQIPDENIPAQMLKPHFPMNNIHIGFGFRIVLNQ
jgi:hypothetical protein